jgi:beta-glucosidase-like glycosyl hydrolase/CubicO group peptidase (beta-lactamase class C family)
MKKLFLSSIILLFAINLFAQDLSKNQWVDSIYQSLSLEERFGQLLMIRTNQPNQDYFPEIDEYIQEYGIGGVCFFANGPAKQLKQTQIWQDSSKIPLLVGIDGEWGLGMRLDSTISYPFQMTLGSIQNDSLIYEMGRLIGQDCKRMGIHLNFAPVVDINNNPNNPVINSRSFGDDPKEVAKKAAAYMKGMQDEGIIATAKHFPGHGDTGSDSHHTLPLITHDKNRLDSIELFPYKELIAQELSGVMVAHLYIPELEETKNLASTLSPKIISGLLREELGFNGLIVTDALDMSGVTKYFPSGEIEVRALLAGNDILLLPADIPSAIEGLKKAYESQQISEELLEEKCKKILSYKYDLGLNKKPNLTTENLHKDLMKAEALALRAKLYEESITLIENKNLLPLMSQNEKDLAVVSFGWVEGNRFEKSARRYTDATYYYVDKNRSRTQNDSLARELNNFKYVIFNIGKTTIFPQRSFGLTSSEIELIEMIENQESVIINLLGSPLAIQKFFPQPNKYGAFILSHQDRYETQRLSAEMIFGARSFKGKLPVKINDTYPAGFGLSSNKLGLIKEGFPEHEGVDRVLLKKKIDSIVISGIEMRAFPGCQILVVKNGSIIFEQSYGYQTYDSILPVNNQTIYDVASLTKVSASVPVLMRLVDQKKLDLDNPISSYLPYLEGSNKENMIFRDILSHQAQLTAWIPFYWYNTDSAGVLNPDVFQNYQTDDFNIRVAEGLFIKDSYKYQMYDTILKSDLRKRREYKYSDVGYYWVPQILEPHYNGSYDQFVDEFFYQPLHMRNTSYKPRKKFPISRIAPTENDTIFRKQIIRGDVHDPGAAMLGGVCGHAGLFSTAEDIGILFQVYLQNGYYGGLQYFDTATIKEFTSYQHDGKENRRALGFDKPFKKYDKYGPVCESAYLSSFGHSGFTGTYVWADPEEKLIYVFLSNRVYPKSDNYKISRYDIRTNIHQAIYDAIK